ncbi:MAG: hypothetical protein K2N71_05460 [Oscillospiraceae bacterium]|nr:hypothetical protein [Oscillospiraceae bacterium]
MQTKLSNNFSLRNSFRSRVTISKMRNSSKNLDVSSRTGYFRGTTLSGKMSSIYRKSSKSLQSIKIGGNTLLTSPSQIAKDDFEDKTIDNFKVINKAQSNLNDSIPKWLKEAGVPTDVSFEFDYNIDTQKAEITKISDEAYRESVEAVLNKKCGSETLYTAYASRVMNGNISSAYYPEVAKDLKKYFGQDINELSLDRRGNIKGANSKLQKAINASKKGNTYTNFPSQNIVGLLKRLLSDKDITPNVSHMGYDGKSVYTDDGKFKLGKDFDPSFFNEKRYVMRGSAALYGSKSYDSWLENEKKF